MRKYSFNVWFVYNQQELISILKEVVNVLGFTPSIMYLHSEESSVDVTYTEQELVTFVGNGFSFIHILNKEYDESEDYYWFRITHHQDYKILQLEWHNNNLDFLLNTLTLRSILKSQNFIFGYANDIIDKADQSKKEVQRIVGTDPNDPYKWESVVEKIDTSTHWGRSENTCGLEFMAAPLMWFGEHFYKIISKQELLEFRFSSLIIFEEVDLVSVKLFDIYDSPAKEQNRAIQKEFWKFFNLEKVIAKYRKENEIVDSLEDIIARARMKKKR